MKKKLMKILEYILALFARLYIARTKPFIVWVTGSVGKTSCRVIISQVFSQILGESEIVYTSPKNFNSELGLIFSIFKIESYSPSVKNLCFASFQIIYKAIFSKKTYDILVLEYGIDHPWDMDFLVTIAKPDIAVFTKLDKVHCEYFVSDTWIWDEKVKLLHNAKQKIYLNYLDENCQKYYDSFTIKKSYYWSIEFGAKNYKLIEKEQEIFSDFLYWEIEITSNLLWIENAEYICLALQMLDDLKVNNLFPWELAKKIHIPLELQWGRFSVFQGKEWSLLIDSSYNATLWSMKQMIRNTVALRDEVYPDYKLGLVLWDMRELWKQSEEEHLKLWEFIEDYNLFFTVWEETKKYIDKPNVQHFLSSRKAWEHIKVFLENTDEKFVILFKWSQNTIFTEEALKKVLLFDNESKQLVRQDSYWLDLKEKFYNNL